MRIRFEVEGGFAFFPGLRDAVTVETGALPPEEAEGLRRLVEETDFFGLPEETGGARAGAADHRCYKITAEDGVRGHTVRVTDPVADPGLRALVGYLSARAKASRKDASRGRPREGPDGAG